MLLLALGVLVIGVQDPIIKSLTGAYPASEALLIRSVAAMPLFAFLLWRARDIPALWRPKPAILVARASILLLAYTSYFLSFPAMPLANVVALYFTAPLFVVALSPLVVGERPTIARWVAVAVGFVGVLVIARPTEGGIDPFILLPLIAGATYAFGQLLARRGSGQGTATLMAYHQNAVFLIGAAAFAVIAAPFAAAPGTDGPAGFLLRAWSMPDAPGLFLMAACGPIAVVGTTLLAKAYREAPPSAVVPLEYTLLLWAILWGFLFFGEVPTLPTLIGAILIVAAGIFAMTRPDAAPAVPEHDAASEAVDGTVIASEACSGEAAV